MKNVFPGLDFQEKMDKLSPEYSYKPFKQNNNHRSSLPWLSPKLPKNSPLKSPLSRNFTYDLPPQTSAQNSQNLNKRFSTFQSPLKNFSKNLSNCPNFSNSSNKRKLEEYIQNLPVKMRYDEHKGKWPSVRKSTHLDLFPDKGVYKQNQFMKSSFSNR